MKVKEYNSTRICNKCESPCKKVVTSFIFKSDEEKHVCTKCRNEHNAYEIYKEKKECQYCHGKYITFKGYYCCKKCDRIVDEKYKDNSPLVKECIFFYNYYGSLSIEWRQKARDNLYKKLIKLDEKNLRKKNKNFNNMKNKLENLK